MLGVRTHPLEEVGVEATLVLDRIQERQTASMVKEPLEML